MTRQSEVGYDEFSNIRYNVDVRCVEYGFGDLDASAHTLTVVIPAGTYVLGVGHHVTEAFAGGTPSLDIGDGSDADAWIASASISETTKDNYVVSMGGGAANGQGYYFATAGKIVLTHAASLTAGRGILQIFQFQTLKNWRVPGYPA